MIDFGDELTIESYKTPWLIWIQILILLLLFLFLCCFSVFTNSDLCDTRSTTINNKASSSNTSDLGLSSSKPFLKTSCINSTSVTNRLQHNQIIENQSINRQISTSTGRRIVIEDNNTEPESSSAKDRVHNNLHPCNYFRLAKLAILKCLGLDPTSETCSSADQKKER